MNKGLKNSQILDFSHGASKNADFFGILRPLAKTNDIGESFGTTYNMANGIKRTYNAPRPPPCPVPMCSGSDKVSRLRGLISYAFFTLLYGQQFSSFSSEMRKAFD